MPHAGFSADLQPLQIGHSVNSHRVNGYRCFIPISRNRVLTAFLEPQTHEEYNPSGTVVSMRLQGGNNAFYSGVLHIGEGEGPNWITRRM